MSKKTTGTPSELINQLRREIDTIDEQILDLINRRIEKARGIGQVKKANGLPVFVPEREEFIFNRLKELNKGPINNNALAAIFQCIIEETRRFEE
ncbi:MAG: chorismate mutase [Caldithrix sp.]|nr:chorismate mutase [Caldithrix sp.]